MMKIFILFRDTTKEFLIDQKEAILFFKELFLHYHKELIPYLILLFWPLYLLALAKIFLF